MRKSLLTFSLALCLVLGLSVSRAHADVNDFVINNFAADYYLTKDDPQGQLHIVEHINVTFSDFNHGILRALPATYKNQSLKLHVSKISSDSGAPTQYTTYGQNGNTVLKIGDPARTITGAQEYTINYTTQNVVTFYTDHDELYWNINGAQWAQPFERVTATFHLPSGLALNDQKCFTGVYGSSGQDCTITKTNDRAVSSTTRQLEPFETLSTVMSFPTGYFAKPTAADWWRDNGGKVAAVALPPLLIGSFAFILWRRKGKDLKGRGTIIAEYEPPDGLGPAEAGIIMTYRLDPKYISAVIIDLAIRKYLRIVESTEKKILKDTKTYTFELLKNDFTELKSHESAILIGIFTDMSVGAVRSVKDLKNKFYTTTQSLQSSLPKDLAEAGYFPGNPRRAGAGMHIAGVILLFLAFFIRSWISLGLALSAGLLFIFGALMPRRTAKGVEAEETLKGLKLYMQTAEADRIKMLQSPDAPYAAQSDAPQKTVELFEKLLPYAMVLGVENEWAKQFQDIYKQPPDWYSGNWTTFNAIYLTNSLTNSVSAMATSFSPPHSSGSSGFSGGGFSGGGGGGGGGGGW